MPLFIPKVLQELTQQCSQEYNHFTGKPQRNDSGFTLIELMIVVAIVGILALVAVPSFSEQVQLNRLVTNANQLQSVFKFARSEAAKRNESVTLVANAGNWQVTLNDNSVLQQFIPSNTIVVNNLANLIILPTGEVDLVNSATNVFVLSDGNSETTDFTFTALSSGQTTLVKTAPVTSDETLTGG